jgi:hypothetical protein
MMKYYHLKTSAFGFGFGFDDHHSRCQMNGHLGPALRQRLSS